MSDFHEGDLVEATKGETVVRGRVGGCSGDWVGTSRRQIPGLINDGFTIATIERAKPALPTERGWYLDRNGMAWELQDFWNCNPLGTTSRPTADLFDTYGPFTPLESVPETAKKVLDQLRGMWGDVGAPDWIANKLTRIAAEFGVTGVAS